MLQVPRLGLTGESDATGMRGPVEPTGAGSGASLIWIHSSVATSLPGVGTASYSAGMVFTTPTGSKFHRSTDCHQVKSHSEVTEATMDMVGNREPCRSCYHDAPVTESVHAYCAEHNSFRACAHNGGVLIPMVRTHRKHTINSDPGDTYVRYDYVWPEHLHRHVD